MARPPYQPTKRQREDVRLFKADGWADDRIARRLGISRTTLLKHFAAELSDGADEERQEALRLLRRAAKKLNVAAIKEYLRVTGAGSALDDLTREPQRKARVRPLGKKEVREQEALVAGEGSEWGDDLKPLAGTLPN